ncbi:hypothetical protein [Dubosiella newyorkensis]|uniref:hypothetical protein n=1 Tax=Dubosiella newyorkensis TaxID=1862672 RepID=UPI0026F3B4BB|nr:hypothetical protein [Dubosiella newyorkensis]
MENIEKQIKITQEKGSDEVNIELKGDGMFLRTAILSLFEMVAQKTGIETAVSLLSNVNKNLIDAWGISEE